MTESNFKAVDIFIFCVLAAIFEAVNYYATVNLFDLVFLSYTVVLTVLAVYRWGYQGTIVGIVGGITSCIIRGNINNFEAILGLVIGNALPGIVSLLWIKFLGREKIKKIPWLLAYYLSAQIIVWLFRGLVSQLYSGTFVGTMNTIIVTEMMSLIISVIIIFVANRKKGLMIYMHQYIRDVQNEEKKVEELKEQNNYNSLNPITKKSEFDDSAILDGGVLTDSQLKELDDMYYSQKGKGEVKDGKN